MNEQPPALPAIHVRLTVTGDCGHVLGTWTDETTQYGFWARCPQCDAPSPHRRWSIKAEVVADGMTAATVGEVLEIFYRAGAACGD